MEESKDIKSMVNEALARVLAETEKALQSRTYAGRHPELGKMINCVCGHRHRETWIVAGKPVRCELKYSVGRWDPEKKPLIASQTTAKGILGSARFARKRFHPHPNKHDLQLVERTQQKYPENSPYLNDPVECMKESRTQAQRELKKERAAERRKRRRQTDISRRINAGLEKPGSRL